MCGFAKIIDNRKYALTLSTGYVHAGIPLILLLVIVQIKVAVIKGVQRYTVCGGKIAPIGALSGLAPAHPITL